MDEILLHENNKVSAEEKLHENIESNIDENDLYHIEKISLGDKKENIEWSKREFECEIENTCEIEIQNGMTCIHGIKVKKLPQCNLLHDILNPYKHTKI